jgi:phage major head subunit gpT-like protein
LLVVGTANEGHAKYLMMSDRLLETGAANPAKGTAELMVLPGLGTKWYLLDTTKGVKPLVVQIRKRGDKLISVTGETEGPVFNRRTYQYSVESRDNAGYALWQLAFGSTGTQSGGE